MHETCIFSFQGISRHVSKTILMAWVHECCRTCLTSKFDVGNCLLYLLEWLHDGHELNLQT
uniref:Uncharacterized protein n=1 Tax=Nelumbo nucifera TaxID=4432 RepID=A0A822ZU39_NELNU|nr:TPA_asm: hypothetical protein HUJ06_003628 [Nelumbo nucifera]